jgi:hypothetical protein
MSLKLSDVEILEGDAELSELIEAMVGELQREPRVRAGRRGAPPSSRDETTKIWRPHRTWRPH